MFMNQVHGKTVVLVDERSSHIATADAMVTVEPGIGLVVLVADCVPVLMWDESTPVVAAVHVGRKGLLNGVALKTLDVMRELGATSIQAEFGPSICGACYEVSEDIYNEVVEQVPSAKSVSSAFEYALDLPQALDYQLRAQSVNVGRSTICTRESQSHYSYRRDGVTGRFAGVIWI